MSEREPQGKDYWRKTAYSDFGHSTFLSSILLPDGEVTRVVLGYLLPGFIQNMVLDLNLRNIQGDILDICAGTTTRAFFPHRLVKERRLIGIDISEKALHARDTIIPYWDKDSQGPLDLAITADLEEKRLTELGIAPRSLAFATMIRAWRYFKAETFKQITQDTFSLLGSQGIFLVVDFPFLRASEEIRSQMGELRIFNKQGQDETTQMFESVGFEEVIQRDLHDEERQLYHHLIMGRKPA